MATQIKSREGKAEEIAELCAQHNCNERIRKIHAAQYVDRRWHPHPPAEFVRWWSQHDDHKLAGVRTVTAWNCQRYRDQYLEVREIGAA